MEVKHIKSIMNDYIFDLNKYITDTDMVVETINDIIFNHKFKDDTTLSICDRMISDYEYIEDLFEESYEYFSHMSDIYKKISNIVHNNIDIIDDSMVVDMCLVQESFNTFRQHVMNHAIKFNTILNKIKSEYLIRITQLDKCSSNINNMFINLNEMNIHDYTIIDKQIKALGDIRDGNEDSENNES